MAWKPGETGNPNGLRGRTHVAAFATLIGKGTPKQLAERIIKQALHGKVSESLTGLCMRMCVDRLWPAIQRVEQSGVEGQPIEHRMERAEMARYLTKAELKQIQEAANAILRRKTVSTKEEVETDVLQ